MLLDPKALAQATAAIVKNHVTRATAPLIERLETLEKRKPEKGEKGERGDSGESIKGETGVGIAGALIDRSGVLVLTLSDGTTRELGQVVGKDGVNGENGRDAALIEPEEGLSEDEQTALATMFLQREIGEGPVVELPALPVAKAALPQVNVKVENHIPRKGREKTTVTKHDERGRVAEFERTEIED